MFKGRRIALVEDNDIMGSSIVQRLELEGAEVLWLRLMVRALGALRTPRAPIDAVICDIHLPDGSGETLFKTLCQTNTPPPFLFITGHGGIEQAVRLLQAGAQDYVTKPFDMPQFLERLRLLMRPRVAVDLAALMGVSEAARNLEALAAKAAAGDDPVLIRGGIGTGKALLARRIHDTSDRRSAPFVSVDLARSETPDGDLFGFGGAAETVGDGTLFVNAIERLSSAAQDHFVGWLDSSPTCRIISACGPQIEEVVAKGGFRRDLYYRLDRMELPIPPLRERPEDAVWLLNQLFARLNARCPTPLKGISALAEQAVAGHDWPGNGRELRARLQRGLQAAQGDWLFPVHLFPERQASGDDQLMSLSETRDAAERAQILAALERCGGRVVEAAKQLKVSRTTLWEKMQKLGL